MKHRYVTATATIKVGSPVLVRGFQCSPASADIANGTALADWPWNADEYLEGQRVKVEMITGLGERSLQAIANGPIMDGCQIYLPAGKCSVEEMKERER